MRKLARSGYCIGLLLLASLTLNAQGWQALVLQKTKAAQTIETIKSNLREPAASSLYRQYLKQQRQEKNKFFQTVKQVYPQAQAQAHIQAQYNYLNTLLHTTPGLQSYALTIQHPADLYTLSTEEKDLIEQVFRSFKDPKSFTYTPFKTLQFSSGAVILSFKPQTGKDIHFAFKPQENILKIAVGDFPVSQQEFGPLPKELNEK